MGKGKPFVFRPAAFNDQIEPGSMMERAARDPELMRKINRNRRDQQRRDESFEMWAKRGFMVWEGD